MAHACLQSSTMASKGTRSKKGSKRSKDKREHSPASSSSSEDELERDGAEETTESVAPPIVKEVELQRFEDLGLGRGLNATDLTPWINKSSFQVREVTPRNVIGTDEGGTCVSYESEIHSTFSLQTELQASIAIPQSPITIGVDAEQSRSVSTSRRSVGRKVVNRTISFRADFDDVPMRKSTEQYMQSSATAAEAGDGAVNGANTSLEEAPKPTFEERLCRWIVNRIEANPDAKAVMDEALGGCRRCSPVDDLPRALIHFRPGEAKRRTLRAAIDNACSDFAHTFNITHYVSAVHLGAAEYSVFTEEEYNTQLKTKASVGVDHIGTLYRLYILYLCYKLLCQLCWVCI